MKPKFTDEDIDAVHTLLSFYEVPKPGQPPRPDNENDTQEDHERSKAFAKARDTVMGLINYYYSEVDPTGNEMLPFKPEFGPDAPMTKKDLAMRPLKYGENKRFSEFLKSNPKLLQDAIRHYQIVTNEPLKSALETTLENMTGERLILILQEYDRRKTANKG